MAIRPPPGMHRGGGGPTVQDPDQDRNRRIDIIRQRMEEAGITPPSRMGAVARGFGQGLTVGLSDEMMAGFRSIPSLMPGGETPGEAYTRNVADVRGRNQASREAYPWTYGLSEVTGAISPIVGAALITAPAGGAGAVPVATSTAARLAQIGTTGARAVATRPALGMMSAQTAARPVVGAAIEGGAQAFGHAEGMPWERVLPTGIGVGAGAVLGPVAQAGTRGTGYMLSKGLDLTGLRPTAAATGVVPNLMNRMGVETVEDQAARRVAETLPPAGSPELKEAVEMLERHPEATIMDVSQQTRGAARGATSVPGTAKEDIPAFLHRRGAGQEERIIDDVLRLSDQNNRRSFAEATEEIMERQRTDAAPLYDEAYSAPPISRDIIGDDILKDETFKSAYETGVRIAKQEGVTLPPLTDDLAALPVQAIDYMKRGMDDVIQMRSGATATMGRQEARALQTKLREMLGRVDEQVPAYNAARSVWGGGEAEKEALELGRKLFNTPASDVEAALARMGEAERELFVRGGVEGMAQRLEMVASNRNLTLSRPLSDRTADRERMRLLFPSDEAFNEFVENLTNEARMASTGRFVMQQSATVDKLLEVAAMSGVDLTGLMSGGVVPVAVGALKTALRGRQAAASGEVAGHMAPLLTARGQDAAEITQRLMGPQQQSVRREYVTRGGPTVSAATYGGTVAGEAQSGSRGRSGLSMDEKAFLREQGLTEDQIEALDRTRR